MTTPLRDLPPRIQDRYGYRPASKLLMGLGIALCILIVGIGVFSAYRIGTPEVYFKLLAWKAVDSEHTSITFEVDREPTMTLECALRVQDRDHVDLGYAVVTVPPGKKYQQVTYQVATNELGYAAEVLACAPQGQLSATPPLFPPDKPNPPQPWRP